MGTKTKAATKGSKTKRTKKKSKITKAAATHSVAFNVSVPPALLKKIDVKVRKSGLPRSAWVRQQLQARV